MAQREHVFRGGIQSEHAVHFFDDDTSRVSGVAAFFAEALKNNRSVISIARARHWSAIADQLKREGVVVDADARVVVLDADVTLRGMMRQGRFDPLLFRKAVAPLVIHVAAAAPAGLSAYGEMVDILAAEGNFTAAQELEAAWNELAAETSLTLLCGYSSAHFALRQNREAMTAICAAHGKVRTDSPEALGDWLLRRALA